VQYFSLQLFYGLTLILIYQLFCFYQCLIVKSLKKNSLYIWQICRVEDLLVNGIVKGSIIHIHRARTIIIDADGLITASELGSKEYSQHYSIAFFGWCMIIVLIELLFFKSIPGVQLYIFNSNMQSSSSGCSGGIGKGNYSKGAGSGAGHGGRGGSGCFNGIVSNGGNKYGKADLPCELGSGTEGPNQSYGNVIGGGMIGIIFINHKFSNKIFIFTSRCYFFCLQLIVMLNISEQ
jgi:uncharacterized membrane protein YgcG